MLCSSVELGQFWSDMVEYILDGYKGHPPAHEQGHRERIVGQVHLPRHDHDVAFSRLSLNDWLKPALVPAQGYFFLLALWLFVPFLASSRDFPLPASRQRSVWRVTMAKEVT